MMRLPLLLYADLWTPKFIFPHECALITHNCCSIFCVMKRCIFATRTTTSNLLCWLHFVWTGSTLWSGLWQNAFLQIWKLPVMRLSFAFITTKKQKNNMPWAFWLWQLAKIVLHYSTVLFQKRKSKSVFKISCSTKRLLFWCWYCLSALY